MALLWIWPIHIQHLTFNTMSCTALLTISKLTLVDMTNPHSTHLTFNIWHWIFDIQHIWHSIFGIQYLTLNIQHDSTTDHLKAVTFSSDTAWLCPVAVQEDYTWWWQWWWWWRWWWWWWWWWGWLNEYSFWGWSLSYHHLHTTCMQGTRGQALYKLIDPHIDHHIYPHNHHYFYLLQGTRGQALNKCTNSRR